MDTMINTTDETILVTYKIDDVLLEDKINHPVDWPLSPRSIRTAIAEHYAILTSQIKIVSFVLAGS